MANFCTKVTVRRRPIKNGQQSLYLDFYPPIRHPKTGKMSRREYLGFYIYANPVEKFQQEYNRSILQKAELIRCQRTEAIINEEYGFLDRSKTKESFLDYFMEKAKASTNRRNWEVAYRHLYNYTKGSCRFCDLSLPLCQGFLDYLMSPDNVLHSGKQIMGTTANNNFTKLKAVVRMAYEDGYIKENISVKMTKAKAKGNKRSYLNMDELMALYNTKCESDVVYRAGLFSCLTGLRLSDIILLKWDNIKIASDGGWVLDITTKKTQTDAVLPISEEALELCGERGEGQVFKGLKKWDINKCIKKWIEDAGITKHITFHSFRHTFATLQMAAGTDIYTLSKMLTHSNLATTQVYTEVVSSLKREASTRISLKNHSKDE